MRKLAFCAGLVMLSSLLFAQTTITGKITDLKTGSPISGVSVKVKQTKKGAQTDNDGVFKIQASAGNVLEITSVGYKTQSVTVTGQSDITISLEQGSLELNEVVVTGNRGTPRVRTESPVPIDVVRVNQVGETTAKPDLMNQLNMAVPSFNYNKQSGGDGSDAIDLLS
jgi:iron complex outermembrane recepter protein